MLKNEPLGCMTKGGVIIIKISDRANKVGFLLTSATNFEHDDLKKLLSVRSLDLLSSKDSPHVASGKPTMSTVKKIESDCALWFIT